MRDALHKGNELKKVCDELGLTTEKLATAVREDLAKMAEMEKVISRDQMKVVFFGRTSNGKSTVINALLKKKILPVGIGARVTPRREAGPFLMIQMMFVH